MSWADNSSDWRLFLEMLSPARGESVLDVGAGRGAIASKVRSGTDGPDVWAIEPQRGRIHHAPGDYHAPRVLLGVAEALPFPDSFFDKVYATLSMHHFHDPPAALHEVARVTKTGGRFVALEVDPHSAKGLLFRVVGRLTGESMHLMTQAQLAEAVGSVGGFKVTRADALGSLHFLQAARV